MKLFENGDLIVFRNDDVKLRFQARSFAHTIQKHHVSTQTSTNTKKRISVFENTRLSVEGVIDVNIDVKVDVDVNVGAVI